MGDKDKLFAVRGADYVGGIGAIIVGGAGGKVGEVADKLASACTVIGMVVGEGRQGGGAEAYSPLENRKVAVVEYIATRYSTLACDFSNGGCSNSWHSVEGGE